MHLQARPDDIYLPTLRDVVHPLFRYRRAVVMMFVAVATAVGVAAALAERTYTAEMKILVKRERLDPIVTSDQQVPSGGLEVRESELFAEVELLTSRDLLEQVAVSSGLHAGGDPGAPGHAERLEHAVSGLRAGLTVTPIRKTTMISVAYRSRDPQLAARVLEQVAAHYLAKHLSVHRPAGARQFFAEQAARSEEALRAAEAGLAAFTAREHVVSPPSEQESTLQKLSEFEATLEENTAAIAAATRRMSAVEAELAQTPARQVTQVSDGGNVDVMRNLRGQILQLEIKRGDLLQKFTPRYPPVVQLEAELEQLRRALAAAEQTPLTDERTDQNPTHQWLRNEAARVRTERDALVARGDAIRRAVASYRERARRLEALSNEHQALLRDVKAAQDNVVLYQRKQEEARISDALDHTRIANVAVAEPPAVPRTPHSLRRPILIGGGLASILLSLGAAYLLHALNPRFRTPDEVYRVLDVPVLASLPAPK